MKKSLLLSLLIWVFVMQVKADSPTDIIEQANQAYIQGEYLYAIELYEQLLSMDLEAAELYYNLGNSYFKENRLAPAILNYERALRLKPFDANIQYNLEVARSRTIDRIDPVPVIFYERWWRAFVYFLDIDRWAIYGLVSLFIGLAAMLWYWFTGRVGLKKFSLAMSLFFLMIGGLAFLAAQRQYAYNWKRQEAIVFVPRVTAKGAPGHDSPDLFVVHEGTKVMITDALGDWVEVKLENGNIGWLQKSSIIPVHASGAVSPAPTNG